MTAPLDRTWYTTLVDDDGSGTTGTVWNKAAVDSLLDAVDASLVPVLDRTGAPALNQIALFHDGDTIKGTTAITANPAGGITLESPTYAYLQLVDQAQPANSKIVRVANTAGSLLLFAMTDVGAGSPALEVRRDGRVVVQAGQISFPAVRNPSGDSTTLDDYREGNWVPIVTGSSGASGQSYSNQTGNYIKIGRLVTAWGTVILSALGTISGTVRIGGLPFTATDGGAGVIAYYGGLTSSIPSIKCYGTGGTAVDLFIPGGAGTMGGLLPSQLTATADFRVQLSYFTPS